MILILIFVLSACSSGLTNNEGKFLKSMTDTITIKYSINHNNGFSVGLDFKLTAGKVDWEIVNFKNEIVFKGYIIYENGNVVKELTNYPENFIGTELSIKDQEIKKTNFSYLQFEPGSIAGEYTLKLTPEKAEGSYNIRWTSKINDV